MPDSSTNPYAGTEHQAWWEDGFHHGTQYPEDNANPTPPSAVPAEEVGVWKEGVLAGSEHSRMRGADRVDADPEKHEDHTGHTVHTVIEGGKTALEIIGEGVIHGGVTATMIIPVLLFLAFQTEGPAEKDGLVSFMEERCKADGCSELHMAFCGYKGLHGSQRSDVMTSWGVVAWQPPQEQHVGGSVRGHGTSEGRAGRQRALRDPLVRGVQPGERAEDRIPPAVRAEASGDAPATGRFWLSAFRRIVPPSTEAHQVAAVPRNA